MQALSAGAGSAIHGVAVMLVARPYLSWGDVEEFADPMLSTVVTGRFCRLRSVRRPRRTP